MRELPCALCMISWLIFGAAVYLGLKASDARRQAEVLRYWRIYNFRLREVLRTPIGLPKYEKLAQELYSMNVPVDP